MNRVARAGVTLVVGGMLALTASPAWAHSDPVPDGGGEWVPLPPEYYAPIDVAACGTTVTITGGDVQEVESRETLLPDGTVVVDFRGGYTVDLTRADGAMIDELDISGPAQEVYSPDGTQITNSLWGASLVFPGFGPVDEAAFAEAGLPDLGYYREGVVTFHITVSDPESQEIIAEEIDVKARVIDLCKWFDREDDWHRDDGHDRNYAHAGAHR